MYFIDTDASLFAIGTILSQLRDGEEPVIACERKSVLQTQRWELHYKALACGCRSFQKLPSPVDEFIIYTDHAGLVWLMNFREEGGGLLDAGPNHFLIFI